MLIINFYRVTSIIKELSSFGANGGINASVECRNSRDSMSNLFLVSKAPYLLGLLDTRKTCS